jgi:hypothetical protein
MACPVSNSELYSDKLTKSPIHFAVLERAEKEIRFSIANGMFKTKWTSMVPYCNIPALRDRTREGCPGDVSLYGEKTRSFSSLCMPPQGLAKKERVRYFTLDTNTMCLPNSKRGHSSPGSC